MPCTWARHTFVSPPTATRILFTACDTSQKVSAANKFHEAIKIRTIYDYNIDKNNKYRKHISIIWRSKQTVPSAGMRALQSYCRALQSPRYRQPDLISSQEPIELIDWCIAGEGRAFVHVAGLNAATELAVPVAFFVFAVRANCGAQRSSARFQFYGKWKRATRLFRMRARESSFV